MAQSAVGNGLKRMSYALFQRLKEALHPHDHFQAEESGGGEA